MKQFSRIVAFLLVLCMVLSVAPQITIARAADADANLWIDPVNGNDANDGTTEAKALKTINAAKTKAAALSADSDVVVILKGGTYDATETIVFGAAESGKNGHTITYRAASGETALISGGKELGGWTLHDAANNIYVTDVPAGAELTRQFYVNGEPQPMAATELTPHDWKVIDSNGYRSGVINSADSTHYLKIDLGADQLVSSVVLYGDAEASADTGKAMGFPVDFTIQTSADGYVWKTQVTETGYTAPNALGGVEFVFDSVAARYIKIEATKLGNPGKNTQTGATQNRLAFAEVQVGFTSKTNDVNLGIAQHVDLDSALASASNVTFSLNNPYVLNIGTNATAVAGITLSADSASVGVIDNIKVQVTTDGSNWKTVYTKNGYAWDRENTITFNPIGATQIRIINASDISVKEIKVLKPTNMGGSVTAAGTGAASLMDGVIAAGYNSNDQVSAASEKDIVINLGSVQDVGGVRLYPTYTNGKVAGYLKAARILVSTDGVTYNTALELPVIDTPTSGAQLLVFPRGYKAQYIKIQPMLLTKTDNGYYNLQLDEVEIVPSKIDAINVEDDVPNIVTKELYENISWSGATPLLGYYDNVDDLSGTPIDFQCAVGEDLCVIDGKAGSRGVTYAFNYDELVKYGGTKVPAFYVTLESAVTFNALNLLVHDDLIGAPLVYAIEAFDGSKWIELANESSNPWVANETYEKNYSFDTVTATAVRVLIYDLAKENGDLPGKDVADDGSSTVLSISELTLANMTTITYEEAPNLDAGTVAYDKVNLSGGNILGFGYYNSSDLNTIINYQQGNASNIVDGNVGTIGSTNGQQYQWMPPLAGSNMPALLLDATKKGKPSTINAIEMVVREDGLCAPYDFEIQVTTNANYDNWITVASGDEVEWKTTNKALYKFAEMDVYKVRLVCTNLTPSSNIPREDWKEAVTTYLQLCEFSLYNINDPTNPIATDLVSQGTSATGTVSYDPKSATASSEATDYKANRAVDGFIEPMIEVGFNTGASPVKYNLANLWHPENVEMHTLYLWYHRIQHFTSATNDGTEIYIADGLGTRQGEVLMPTWISNDYIFIDTPGEWYIDRYEGKIYYKADGTMDGKTAILPVTEQVLVMDYAKNIKFEGITFSHTTWTYPSTNDYRDQQSNGYLYNNTWTQVPSGVDLTGCTNVIFDGVQIRNMGTAGIRIKSDGDGISDGVQVLNSLICDISYNGITVGQIYAHHGYKDWMLVKNTTIRNNYVTRIGIDMFDSIGIFAAYTNGLVVDHNEVSYTPYSGISLGWGWDQEEVNSTAALTEVGNNQITNNYIHDVCKTNYDGGAIYTLGWQQGSVISGNYIHDSGTTAGKTENAIYLDEGTTHMQITGNVIDTVAQSWLQIWFDSIHDNTSTGNYYNSALSTRGIYVNYGNTTKNNISFSSLASNASAKAIADAAGLTDNAFKADNEAGFTMRQDIVQNYWGGTDDARNIYDYQGWYNVRISGQVGTTSYDNVNKIATIVMPKGTDLTALSLQYANESGWNVTPGTGTTQDFTNPVTYTITSAGGGTTKNWTVRVVEETEIAEQPVPPVNDDPTVDTVPTEAPTEAPKPVDGVATGTYLDLIPESSLIPYVGDYVDGNFNNLVNQDPGEAAYLTNVDIGSAGWIGTSGKASNKVQAAVIELAGGAKMIGGVELIARQNDYLKAFDIQVKKTDGTWVSVANVTEDPFDGVRSVMYTFDAVEGTAIRVLCYDWSSSRPMLQEIAVYEAKTGNILQEVVPAGVTSNKGSLTAEQVVGNVIDGDRGNLGAAYYQTQEMPVQLTFDVTKDGAPSNVSRMIAYAFATNKYAPAMITLEAQTGVDTWEEIYSGIAYENGATDTFVLDFPAVDAYAMRLTVNNSIAQTLILTEVDFFGFVKETVKEPVQLEAPTSLTATEITDSSITVTADAVTGGTLLYRINGGDWQTSGTFTGLKRYTRYTIEAMYEATSENYISSETASIVERTAKTQLTAPTGLVATEITTDSITVTADTLTGGNLRYRINGGAWQTSGTFTGLTLNTTYTIEAKYAATSGYTESAATAIEVTTKGHTYTAEQTKAPTCTEAGEMTYTCSCGDSYTEEIKATGHTLTSVNAKAPTCTEAGHEAYEYCSVCDYTTFVEIPATGHTHTPEQTKAPTCTTAGEMTYTCSCGDSYTEEIKATGHTLNTVEAKDPTCTEAGHEAYEYCSVCDYTTFVEIPATGHTYTPEQTKAPSCTTAGEMTYTCSCGDSYTEEIKATGHTEVEDANGTHCDVCGEILSTKEPVIVETNALSQVTYNVRLIEPWAIRINVKFFTGTQSSPKNVPVSSMTSYGAYGILASKYENAANMSIEELIADPDAVKIEMSATEADGSIYPVDANTLRFDFSSDVYTYRLSEDVYWIAYYADAEGNLHFTRVRNKNLTSVMDGLKNASEKEANVYTSMKTMEQAIIAYRGTLSNLTTIYPAGVNITESGIGFAADNAPGTYKFAQTHSIKLIEPWGIKVNVLMVKSTNTSKPIDYAAADDYGLIFFHDKTGKYEGGMSVAQMIAEGDAVVYSKSLGNATIEASRVSAIYDQNIFTFEMDSDLYVLPFVVIDGEYHYRDTGAFNMNLIDRVALFATETTKYSAEERAVYTAMVEMNQNILIFRGM